jgi:hypothetical protein
MKEYNITVDVYAHWGERPPRYRIYMDKDLLTEREFIWNGADTYIKEHIIVNLEPGAHALKIEHINNAGTLQTKNVTVNGSPSSLDFVVTE